MRGKDSPCTGEGWAVSLAHEAVETFLKKAEQWNIKVQFSLFLLFVSGASEQQNQAVPGLLTSREHRMRLKGPRWLWLHSNTESTRAFVSFSLVMIKIADKVQNSAWITWDHSNSLVPRSCVSWHHQLPNTNYCFPARFPSWWHTASERSRGGKAIGKAPLRSCTKWGSIGRKDLQ